MLCITCLVDENFFEISLKKIVSNLKAVYINF